MVQLGGTLVENEGEIDIGDYTYTGSVTAGTVYGTGTFTVAQGWTVPVNSFTQTNLGNDGHVIVNTAGTIANVYGTGSFTVASAATVNVSNFYQNSLENNGLFNMNGAGTVGVITGTGVLTINSGARLTIKPNQSISYQNGLTLNGSGTLDITNNSLVITYSPNYANGGSFDPSVETAVRNSLISGYDNGAWDGTGITSSTAATDQAQSSAVSPYYYQSSIGYADNNELGRTDIPDNSVLVRFTYAGDADLNGTVDLVDFDAWLFGYQHQGLVTHDWANGDFDYDGSITLADEDVWMFAYERHLGSLGAARSMQLKLRRYHLLISNDC